MTGSHTRVPAREQPRGPGENGAGRLTPEARPARLVIVDDHPSVRRGLVALLGLYPDRYQVVGEAGSVPEAEALLSRIQADLVVTDLSMRPLDGLVLMQRLRQREPLQRFMVFTADASPERARLAIQAGAGGLVLKEADEAELLRCLDAVLAGYLHLPAELAHVLARPVEARPQPTLRERDVLACIADGLTNKEIARRLGMEPRTVESHRANIMRRFGLGSSAQLVKFAVERRWQ